MKKAGSIVVLATWAAAFPAPSVAEAGDVTAFQVFSRSFMEDVTGRDAPSDGERIEALTVTLARGEYEPVTVSVRAYRELGEVRVELGELRSADGAVLPTIEVTVSLCRQESGVGSYKRTDYMLRPGKSAKLSYGETARFWITVHAPEDLAPGTYRATLRFVTEREGAREMPFAVNVLPFALEDVPDRHFALLITAVLGQYYGKNPSAKARERGMAIFRDMRAHGMTCICPKCCDWPLRKRGDGTPILTGLETEVELAMAAGLKGPVLWYMSSLINCVKGGKNFAHYDGKCDNWNEARDLANLRAIVAYVKKKEKAGGWPEVIFYTVDEPGTQTENVEIRRLRLATLLPKTLKVVGECGARGLTTMTEPVDEKHNRWLVKEKDELRKLWDLSRPYCHIRLYGYGSPQGRTNLRHEMEDAKRRGHEVWLYHNPAIMGRDRRHARMFYGYYGWRTKVRGITSWTYPGAPTVQFECVREGIDDAKYLALLESRLARSSGPAADRARAFLAELHQAVKLDPDGKLASHFTVREFARCRAALIGHIEALRPRLAAPAAGVPRAARIKAS